MAHTFELLAKMCFSAAAILNNASTKQDLRRVLLLYERGHIGPHLCQILCFYPEVNNCFTYLPDYTLCFSWNIFWQRLNFECFIWIVFGGVCILLLYRFTWNGWSMWAYGWVCSTVCFFLCLPRRNWGMLSHWVFFPTGYFRIGGIVKGVLKSKTVKSEIFLPVEELVLID